MGIGVGYGMGATTVEPEDTDGDIEFKTSGVAVQTELAIGGTVAPGLVIGVGSYGAGMISPKGEDFETTGALEGSAPDDLEGEWDSITLNVLGPFIDYYFDPLQGTHLQFAIGYATLAVSDGEFKSDDMGLSIDLDEDDGSGFGAMAGIGYETWAGEQWSIGGLARVLVANPTIEGEVPGEDVDADWKSTLIVPGVLFTATYH